MALKLDRIIEDLSDPNAEIQILALTTIPRITPDLVISPEEALALNQRIAKLSTVDNPDVVFLARKAQNFLSKRAQAPADSGPRFMPAVVAQPPPTTPPREAPKEPPKEPRKEPKEPPKAAPPPPTEPTEPTAMEIAVSLSTEKDTGRLATALGQLRRMGEPRVLSLVGPFLGHADPRVRANAVEVFDELGDRKVIALLLPMLRDENNRVRSNAAKALGKYGVPEVTECLTEMLRSDQVRMRESALYAITCLKDVNAFPLVAPLTQDPYDGIRNRLVTYLDTSNTPWAEELLKRMVGDRHAEIREKAVQALVVRGVPVEGLLQQVASAASEVPSIPVEPKESHEKPPSEPVLDSTVERTFRTTLVQILKDLRNQERRAALVRTLFQAGVVGYQLCRSGEFKHPDARSLYYEVEQYQEFLREYTGKLTSAGKDLNQLQVQIVTTGLAQYQGRLKVALIKMGRLLASLIRSGTFAAPPDLKEALENL